MTPLHTLGDFLRDLMLQIPLSVVRVLFIALPVVLLVWVLTLPQAETTAPEESGRGDANLKIGAAIALGAQIAIYSLL